jgi:DNA-binding response OmpR family regulator
VELTAREFGLLHALALEAGNVLSIDEIIARKKTKAADGGDPEQSD